MRETEVALLVDVSSLMTSYSPDKRLAAQILSAAFLSLDEASGTPVRLFAFGGSKGLVCLSPSGSEDGDGANCGGRKRLVWDDLLHLVEAMRMGIGSFSFPLAAVSAVKADWHGRRTSSPESRRRTAPNHVTIVISDFICSESLGTRTEWDERNVGKCILVSLLSVLDPMLPPFFPPIRAGSSNIHCHPISPDVLLSGPPSDPSSLRSLAESTIGAILSTRTEYSTIQRGNIPPLNPSPPPISPNPPIFPSRASGPCASSHLLCSMPPACASAARNVASLALPFIINHSLSLKKQNLSHIVVVIDATRSLFSPCNILHTVSAISALLLSFSMSEHRDQIVVDVIVSSSFQSSANHFPQRRATDYINHALISLVIQTVWHIAGWESSLGTALSSALHPPPLLDERMNAGVKTVFVLSDASVILMEELDRLRVSFRNNISATKVVGIGLGSAPLFLPSLIPNAVYAADATSLGESLCSVLSSSPMESPPLPLISPQIWPHPFLTEEEEEELTSFLGPRRDGIPLLPNVAGCMLSLSETHPDLRSQAELSAH